MKEMERYRHTSGYSGDGEVALGGGGGHDGEVALVH